MIHVDSPRIAILVFDEVELLDFTGPLEVFSCVKDVAPDADIQTFTLALNEGKIACRSGLDILPNYTLENQPGFNILLIPGGMGVRKLLADEAKLQKINTLIRSAKLVLSVCTGSLLLAILGYLKEKKATTHHTCFHDLARLEPACIVQTSERFCDEGGIITAGGISAGIDMSLHVVGQLLGEEIRSAVEKEMEWMQKHL
jgi:transcriptional regulator GlxA family with amidase domain